MARKKAVRKKAAKKATKKGSGDSAADLEENRVNVREAFNLLKADNKYIVYHKSKKQLDISKGKRTKAQIKADHVKFIDDTIKSETEKEKKRVDKRNPRQVIGNRGRPKKHTTPPPPARKKDAFGLWVDT